jgi:hypothetical protein
MKKRKRMKRTKETKETRKSEDAVDVEDAVDAEDAVVDGNESGIEVKPSTLIYLEILGILGSYRHC